jgi:predicted nucleic acid-binding protein
VKIVIDSYAWIEIFSGSAEGERAKGKIAEAETVFTPDIVLAEIARKYLREGIPENTIRKRLGTILEASQTANIDGDTAVESAKAYIEMERRAPEAGLQKPSLFDAIILATARINQAKVLTGDQHFRGFVETMWLGTG